MDHERREMSEHREPANADMDQAIPCFAEDIASGRVEDSRSLSRKFALCANFLDKDKKSTMLPRAKPAFIG
ncbi:MAG: hypothetical protein ACLFVO_22190 [Chloroflexaceae bacterium]